MSKGSDFQSNGQLEKSLGYESKTENKKSIN